MLRDFKFRVAHGLISEGKTLNKPEQSRKRGRPSMDESPSIPLKRKACSPSPTDDIRRDQIGHFPMCMKKRQRCRSCSKLARVMCRKCGVTLCFTSGKDFLFLSPVIAWSDSVHGAWWLVVLFWFVLNYVHVAQFVLQLMICCGKVILTAEITN